MRSKERPIMLKMDTMRQVLSQLEAVKKEKTSHRLVGTSEPVKKIRIDLDTTQDTEIRKLGRWACPAQDSHPFNTELTAQAEELFATSAELSVEWVRILSGDKPTFPTCEFPFLEGYPESILNFSQLLPVDGDWTF
jgi:hypothetical protein